ncbi:MAG TPA: LPS assembly lipoprotein LptE [Gemmatimonadales bacterium]|nr:LPS assembly lipoprotein LptE [Gemmatimonadales bacterium]
MRRKPGTFLLLLAIASTIGSAGCLYKFAGGGLPANIRTVAVLPFDNLTPEPTLTQEVTRAVREAVQNRLGLRAAGEDQADAVVRGTVQRYNPDVPLTFAGSPVAGQPSRVEVTRRMVQISVDVRIFSQRDGRVLWERSGLMVQGEYEPGQEAEGRRRALEKLINDIVEGAQSQW